MIAYGVNKAGEREILAIEPMFDETEKSWRAFFRKLKGRGLKRLSLCISDAHAGIQAAVRKEWLGTSWQRYKVHFMWNILAKVPHREKARFAERLKQIWMQPDKRSAKRMAALVSEEYEKRFPEAIRCLEEGLEGSLQFYHFPEVDKKRISSTNVLTSLESASSRPLQLRKPQTPPKVVERILWSFGSSIRAGGRRSWRFF
jgi:transposase-like protein